MLRRHLSALLLCLPFAALAQAQATPDGPALPPEAAAASWKLPPGFKATLFAGEPAITQPIQFNFDDRGRLWVIENFSYPNWRADGTGNDRVTILEDTDNDGKHDKRTVFLDNGCNLSGIEIGFGGVWLTSAPNFIFIPDANGDDKPDGPAKVLLDGFSLDAKHNMVGNLAWGPDGWLYGCHGITAPSLVGKPGTPKEKRQVVHCGVWRYHPVRHQFEVYANGTTNPWGLDWDERGELFITNCVIKHLFHVIPGAHYVRMFGQDPNPYVYGLMESCADHQHWAGGHWTSARGGEKHHDFGGGHAHAGCMIYLGDNWPAEYRNNVFTLNIHGQRLNRDTLEPHGSSYIAHHAPDTAFSGDPWFRGLHCKYGPDGGVYISDWSDIGECHDAKEEQIDRTSGRMFKIVFDGGRQLLTNRTLVSSVPSGEFAKLPDETLVKIQGHRNEWLARHARRILQERSAAGKLDLTTLDYSRGMVKSPDLTDGKDIALSKWVPQSLLTLHATRQLDEQTLAHALNHWQSVVRAHAITLAVESPPQATIRQILADIANDSSTKSSPYVRAHLASALQRIPLDDRWPIAEALLAHAEDANDQYLPLMYWYAVEPLVPRNVRKSIELLPKIQIPLVRQYIARRLVAVREGDGAPPTSTAWMIEELLKTLATSPDPVRVDVLRGLKEAYRGRRTVVAPAGWRNAAMAMATANDPEVLHLAHDIGVIYGDRVLISLLEDNLLHPDVGADAADRRRSLELLAARHEPGFVEILLRLLADPALRGDAIRALARYNSPEIPPRLLNAYASLTAPEKQDAIQTLTARPIFALVLLDAIEQNLVPRQDISALTIRQLQSLADDRVNERLTKVWGNIRRASADKDAKAQQLKAQLTPDNLKLADLPHGRAVFTKNCATCHQLFGEGAKIAPDLTGGQRRNLDYVLDNVLDPSAIVPREYEVSVFRLTDGRIVQGVIAEENPQTITVQTANEALSFPVSDIEARKKSPISMMPEGLFDRLSPEEIRDLVAYLATPQ